MRIRNLKCSGDKKPTQIRRARLRTLSRELELQQAGLNLQLF